MTMRPIGPAEWNDRFDPAERIRQSAPNGITVNFQVHGGRITDLEVRDAWTGDTAMVMPAVTATDQDEGSLSGSCQQCGPDLVVID